MKAEDRKIDLVITDNIDDWHSLKANSIMLVVPFLELVDIMDLAFRNGYDCLIREHREDKKWL